MANKIKYPPKYVLREMKRMLGGLKQNKDIIFVGSLFRDKPYSKKTIDVVVKRFINKVRDKKILKDNSDYSIIKSIVSVRRKMAEIIEANIVDTLKIKTAFKKYLLSCCHKWIEEEKRLGLKISHKIDVRYSIEQVPKLANPVLIDGVVKDAISIDKPKP